MRLNKRHKILYSWLLMAIGVLLVSVSVGFLITQTAEAPINKSQEDTQEIVKQDPQPKTITSNLLITGNTYLGRDINNWSMASPLKYAYPFSRLGEFKRDQYDAWITGLECPTDPSVTPTNYEERSLLKFNCDPKYLPELAKWFTAVTLANNHTDNQGVAGFKATKLQLEKNHIQYFGSYDPNILDDVCEVISLPVTVSNDDNSMSKGSLPVAMCGYHGVFQIPPASSVAVMKEYSKYMPVLAFPHMGTEYRAAPDQLKTNFYRSLIDGGADAVLGDHPHWVQTTESYKGHLIVYSMGNFIFDQQGTTEVTRSAAIRVVLETDPTDEATLKSWLAVGEKCSKFKDDCLAQIKAKGLEKLNITYQFGAVGTDDSGKITRPASESIQAGILKRLNWQDTMDKLKLPYSKL